MTDVPIPQNIPRPEVPNDSVLPPAATSLASDGLLSPVARTTNSWQAMLQHLGADANAGIVPDHGKVF